MASWSSVSTRAAELYKAAGSIDEGVTAVFDQLILPAVRLPTAKEAAAQPMPPTIKASLDFLTAPSFRKLFLTVMRICVQSEPERSMSNQAALWQKHTTLALNGKHEDGRQQTEAQKASGYKPHAKHRITYPKKTRVCEKMVQNRNVSIGSIRVRPPGHAAREQVMEIFAEEKISALRHRIGELFGSGSCATWLYKNTMLRQQTPDGAQVVDPWLSKSGQLTKLFSFKFLSDGMTSKDVLQDGDVIIAMSELPQPLELSFGSGWGMFYDEGGQGFWEVDQNDVRWDSDFVISMSGCAGSTDDSILLTLTNLAGDVLSSIDIPNPSSKRFCDIREDILSSLDIVGCNLRFVLHCDSTPIDIEDPRLVSEFLA